MKITARKTRRSPLYRTRVPRVQFVNIETFPGWLELPLTQTNIHGPKPVRAMHIYDIGEQCSASDKNLYQG